MVKAYSSFFFHFPQHVSPSSPPTRAHTYPPSASARQPFRSFLSLDADSSRSIDDDTPLRRPRHAPPALDTRHIHPRASTSSHADRALPRPKPAPMATLPAVPASAPPTHTRYPRPPTAPTARPNTSPAHHKQRKHAHAMPAVPPRSPTYAHHHRTRAAPPTRPPRPAYDAELVSPQSPRSPAAHPHRQAPPVRVKPRARPVSMASASTVSTHHRISNRTDALARLEGRVPRSATLPYSHAPSQPPPFGTAATSSPSPSPSPSPRLPQYSPPPYSPAVAMKSAAPVLSTKSFMPFSDAEDSDDELDEVERDVGRLGMSLSSRLRLGSDSEAEAEDEKSDTVRRGRKKASRTTIASWYVGPTEPNNFMDFGDVDVDVDVDVYDLDVTWKGYMNKSQG